MIVKAYELEPRIDDPWECQTERHRTERYINVVPAKYLLIIFLDDDATIVHNVWTACKDCVVMMARTI